MSSLWVVLDDDFNVVEYCATREIAEVMLKRLGRMGRRVNEYEILDEIPPADQVMIIVIMNFEIRSVTYHERNVDEFTLSKELILHPDGSGTYTQIIEGDENPQFIIDMLSSSLPVYQSVFVNHPETIALHRKGDGVISLTTQQQAIVKSQKPYLYSTLHTEHQNLKERREQGAKTTTDVGSLRS